MKTVWAGSICLALLAYLAMSVRPVEPWPELSRANIAFIGSSLMAAAIPRNGPPDGLLEDGRQHARLSFNAVSESEAMEMLRTVIGSRVEEIFVDIYPYIRTFPIDRQSPTAIDYQPKWTDGLVDPWQKDWARVGDRLRYTAGMLAAGRPTGFWSLLLDEPEGMERVYDGNRRNFGDLYPMDLHPPYAPATLAKVLDEAREHKQRVVFVALPRSREAAEFMGAVAEENLAEAFEAFKRRFGVEVWSPAASWPNEFFRDQGHLNAVGRARFLAAFRAHFGASR